MWYLPCKWRNGPVVDDAGQESTFLHNLHFALSPLSDLSKYSQTLEDMFTGWRRRDLWIEISKRSNCGNISIACAYAIFSTNYKGLEISGRPWSIPGIPSQKYSMTLKYVVTIHSLKLQNVPDHPLMSKITPIY